jgi:hypothetical protein
LGTETRFSSQIRASVTRQAGFVNTYTPHDVMFSDNDVYRSISSLPSIIHEIECREIKRFDRPCWQPNAPGLDRQNRNRPLLTAGSDGLAEVRSYTAIAGKR